MVAASATRSRASGIEMREPDDAAEHVAPELVGAERVLLRRSLERWEGLGEWVVGRDKGREHRDHEPRDRDRGTRQR